MTPDEHLLRKQLAEAEETIRKMRDHLDKAKEIHEPFLAFYDACAHRQGQDIVASYGVKKLSGHQVLNLEVRHFKALEDWHQEGEGK